MLKINDSTPAIKLLELDLRYMFENEMQKLDRTLVDKLHTKEGSLQHHTEYSSYKVQAALYFQFLAINAH